MVIFYLTIPLMLVAIGIAVVPLLWVSVREHKLQRAMVADGSRRPALAGAAPSQITDIETSFPMGWKRGVIGFNILAKCPFRAAGLSSSVEVLPCMRSMQGNSPLNAGWVHSADGEGPPERELASVLSRLMPDGTRGMAAEDDPRVSGHVRDEHLQATELVDTLRILDSGSNRWRLYLHLHRADCSLQRGSTLRPRHVSVGARQDLRTKAGHHFPGHGLGPDRGILRCRKLLRNPSH